MIIDKIKHYGLQCDIDVQKQVLHLRSQRSGMVQTEKQYQFLYVALKEYIEVATRNQQAIKHKQQKPIYLANNSTNSTSSINNNATTTSSSKISSSMMRSNANRHSNRSSNARNEENFM